MKGGLKSYKKCCLHKFNIQFQKCFKLLITLMLLKIVDSLVDTTFHQNYFLNFLSLLVYFFNYKNLLLKNSDATGPIFK